MSWSRSTMLAGELLGSLADPNVDLGPWCTYRVGGPAALLVEARSVEDLQCISRAVSESGAEVLIVGKGSNLLVADAGFDGVVVHLGDGFAEVNSRGTRVVAGGSAMLPIVARHTARVGLSGFEWAVGVPGTVGGAVRMNAGGHGSDMAACLSEVEVVDLANGTHSTLTVDELELGYRRSALRPAQVVVKAHLVLRSGVREDAESMIADIVRWRRANQPGGPNAGSVFANPDRDSAGRLIDATGLKGHRHGSAAISDKHANFIQVDPGGRADDVYALIREIQARILETHGLVLEPENRLIGFDQPQTKELDHDSNY